MLPVAVDELKRVVDLPEEKHQWMNSADMEKLKVGVQTGATRVVLDRHRLFNIDYYQDFVDKQPVDMIYISPQEGFAPCGHFNVQVFLAR